MAPRIPQKRTRCWYRLGILKDLKITAITNTLSMLRESSMRYPVTYFSTALSGVRPVGLGSMSEENSHQITPENPRARLTHTEVQIAASFDFITCAFLLKTPRSRARNSRINPMKIAQTSISVL